MSDYYRVDPASTKFYTTNGTLLTANRATNFRPFSYVPEKLKQKKNPPLENFK